jgi:hypothetical protein
MMRQETLSSALGDFMKNRILAALAGCLALGFGATAFAGETCDSLWVQRNEIYKENGYCFKTRAAIKYFGNAGCVYDSVEDVPLSSRERRIVARIVSQERRYGCN